MRPQKFSSINQKESIIIVLIAFGLAIGIPFVSWIIEKLS